jgi:hypothetical protein
MQSPAVVSNGTKVGEDETEVLPKRFKCRAIVAHLERDRERAQPESYSDRPMRELSSMLKKSFAAQHCVNGLKQFASALRFGNKAPYAEQAQGIKERFASVHR